MASDNKRLNYILGLVDNITAPTAKAQKSVQQMGKQASETQKKYSELQGRLNDVRAYKTMQAQMEKGETLTKAQQRSFDRLGKSLTTAGINVGRLDRAESNLVRAQKSVNSELGKQQELLRKTTDRQNKLTAAKEKAAKAEQAANKAMMTGAKLMAGGVAMAGGVYAAGSPHREYDKGLSAVQAVGRMSSEEKAELKAAINDIAEGSVFNHVDAAGAAGFLAQSGFNKEQIKDALGPVMALAAATSTDLMQTANIASNIMSGFGIPASEMQRAADVMTMAANSFNVDLSMLGETMKYLGPVASKLGISMEESTAMAGLLGNVGIQGSSAGNALRSMAGSLAGGNASKDKVIDQLGLKTRDDGGNLVSMPEILKQLKDKTAGMGNAEMAALMKGLFGEEFYGPAMEIISKGGDLLETAISDMYNAKGAAAEAERVRLDNLDGDIVKFTNQVSAMQMKFGETFDRMYRGIVKFATSGLEAVNAWMKENPKMVKALGLVATAFGAVIGVIGALVGTLGPLWFTITRGIALLTTMKIAVVGLLKGLATLLLRVGVLTLGLLKNIAVTTLLVARWLIIKAVMFAVSASMIVIRGVMAALTAAQWLWNAALAANPIGVIIVAIAALVAAGVWLWKNWGNLPEAFSQLWADICGLFDQGVAWIKEALGFDPMAIIGDMWGGLTDFFDGMFDGIWNKFTGMIGGIVEKVKGLGSWALGGFGMFDDETAEAVKDAPKVSPDTGKTETPKNVTKGNQLAPVRQTVNSNVTVSPAITIHAKEGVDAKELAAEVTKQIADLQRKAERQNRGQLVDGY